MTQQIININMFAELEKKDRQTLNRIQQKGYLNPYDEFPDAMITGENRRYIKDFVVVPYANIEENQVAENIVDTRRCREEIAPSIKKFGLKNPPIATESTTPGRYKLVTGHHRSYSCDMLDGDVPLIVVTKNYNLGGQPVPPDIDIIQGVQANRVPQNRTYSMDDAVLNINESMRLNPTQDGRNPSGKLPPRENTNGFNFDDLMDRLFGEEYFPYPATRTKIYNKCLQGQTKHKILPTSFSDQSAHLARIGYDQGIKAAGKRKEAGEHFDVSRGSIIVMTDSNGKNIDTKMHTIVKKWHLDDGFVKICKENKIRSIDVVARIHKPPSDKPGLDTRRNTFTANIRQWAELMPKMNVGLKIREIAFPKQLKVASDKDHIVPLID